ncbi:hypothetical protein JD844_024908 [Phrynosoma platyrhinos]|uniref:WD repeat-containing protein 64 n=1 Tax=Phrynosoma platyrhinos TaxID=52577 RepID=A0ABQ7SYQ3_PHRPL|nr:hypothetical protein JD844_024908 [Phrynosoma platyrhinos]
MRLKYPAKLQMSESYLLKESMVMFLFVKGDLLKEILPFTKHPPIPLTALCTDVSSKILFAANKAHSTKIVDLFYNEEKNLVVTASTDNSVRVWHSRDGRYFGYFGQRRLFEISESTDIILPCDVNEMPLTIKEGSKYMEKKQKFEYPLVLDKERWKTLTRSTLSLKKPGPLEVDHDFKFFKALASPKINKQPLESFKSGNKDAGVVFGCIPIYRVSSK